ncbi:MAG: TonB-dependent receptor, partial [Tannerella sp.]|nr:TonB-dependent receptor [Tannerella sp.]
MTKLLLLAETSKKILYFPVILLIAAGFSNSVSAQTIRGKVIDSQTNELIVGASVIVKGSGSGTGTVTDINGEFILNIGPLPGVIEVHYLGYKPQEIDIYEISELITIYLTEDFSLLNEVVVVGYGTQKKVNLTGAVSTADAGYIENRPLTNASQALQGLTGLYVNQEGGQPGNDVAVIRIRGVGTLGDNNPLVLVNGIEYSLKDITPEDIESISVLKDAASAAIYGNRAANGVILITTKRGTKSRATLRYNGSIGLDKATFLPDVVDNTADWMETRDLASVNEGQPVVFGSAVIDEWRNATDRDVYPNTNWFDILYRTAVTQKHNFSVSGGNDQLNYFISANYLNQEGVLIATDAEKYSLNTSVTADVLPRVSIGANLLVNLWTRHEPAEGADNLIGDLTRALPLYPNILSTGEYGDSRFITPGHNVFRHPYAKAVEGSLETRQSHLLANIFAEARLPFDVTYKINLAVNKYDELSSRFVPEILLYDPTNMANPKALRFDTENAARSAKRTDLNNLNTTFFQTIDWKKTSGRHTVNLLLGFSRESFHTSDFYAYIEGFLGNDLTELNNGTSNKNVGGTSSLSTLMSYFGRVNYSYEDKYLLEVNLRRDGSSRFARGHKWGLFPSVSGAWKISEEGFLKDVRTISNLKIRASWGSLGNQNIALYSYSNSINTDQGYSFNNTVVAGSAVTTLSDSKISWEKTAITNVGIDVGLWRNSFRLEADAYLKKTSGILARINVPAQVGDLGGPITNLYDMSNRGLEINASYNNSFYRVDYSISAGIAFVRNNVDFLNGDVQYTYRGDDGDAMYIIKEGSPVNSYYLYDAEGLFQTQQEVAEHAFQSANTAPGDIKYRDVNGDNVIDSEDRIITGRTIPGYTYSFQPALHYKGFDLSALFQGVEGVDMYPQGNLAYPNYNGAGITK